MYYPREEKKDYLFHQLVIFIILIFPFSFLLVMNKDDAVLYGVIAVSKSEAQAEIGSIWYTGRGDSRILIEYAFETPDGNSYVGVYGDSPLYYKEEHFIGDYVSVSYSGFFPRYSTISSQLDTYKLTFYFFSFSLILVLYLVYNIFSKLYSIIRHDEEDRHY